MSQNKKLHLVKKFLNKLVEHNVNYIWIHSYNELKGDDDVDIVIDKQSFKNAEKIFNKVADDLELKLIQLLQHESGAKCFVLYYGENQPLFLQIDPCTDYMRNGRILLSAEEILSGKISKDDIFIARPDIEAIYIILKKTLKKEFKPYSKKRIMEIYAEFPEQVEKQLLRFFNNEFTQKMIKAFQTNDWSFIEINITRLRKNIIIKTLFKNPLSTAEYWLKEMVRIVKRILRPTGFVVVIQGPDGSGKSTISSKLMDSLNKGFRHVKEYHWRPGVLPQISKVVKTDHLQDIFNPHKLPVQNSFISLIRIIYYWLDFVLGYLIKIHWRKIRSTFIVFDRYFYDFYIDPRRFRLSLPNGFIKLLTKLVPSPDLIIVLKSSPVEIHSRKKDLPIQEIEKQYQKIDDLFLNNNIAVTVDSSHGIDKMVKESNEIIISELEKRYIERYLK